jgi:hypothetical protein
MGELDHTGDMMAVRRLAAASGIDLDDARAEQLVAALARYRGQVAKLDGLDLDELEPGVADPAADR